MLVDIIGPYPPPYGGISVHIMRLLPYCRANKIRYRVYNHGKFDAPSSGIFSIYHNYLWWLKYLLFNGFSNVAHFHFFTLIHFIYVFIFSWLHNKRIIITLHNEKLLSVNPIMKNLLLFCLSYTRNKTVIAVSQKIATYLNNKHIETLYIPAYIPPVKQKKMQDEFLDIFYSIWQFSEDSINSVYSFDMVVKLLNSIEEENILKSTEYKDYKMHFFIGSKKYNLSLEKKIALIKGQYKIFIYEEKNMSEFLGIADLLIRPNRVDGYGVCIKEALDNDTDAIASNICKRPEGTILFKNNNMDDLLSKFRMFVTGNLKYSYQQRIETDYHMRLINIYNSTI